MRLMKITTCYPGYLDNLYKKHVDLKNKTYAEQKSFIDYDAFGWADFWSEALTPLGYDMLEVTLNAELMQRAWMQENVGLANGRVGLQDIALAQVKHFKPDIIWYDYHDTYLLSRIRSETPSLRFVLGWTGSAIPVTDVWPHMDLVLSCAPESVEQLRSRGIRAEHLHHGFDPRIISRLKQREKIIDFSFVGQLIRSSQYHLEREKLLLELAQQVGIAIYTPSAEFGVKEELTSFIMKTFWKINTVCNQLHVPEAIMHKIPLLNRVAKWQSTPVRPVNAALKKHFHASVYGLNMFQVLRDSKIVLNAHADSSPMYASNMRLFETTGVGSCMMVDWKANLNELFDTDTEIVTYKNVDECVEKARWLMSHPDKMHEIALAGQQRTLKEHTFVSRAYCLDKLIRKYLHGR